jgi:homoserine acetyltransferase
MNDERQPAWPVTGGVLELGNFPAERGGVIAKTRLVCQAHGTLNEARDNMIVYPCSYTATHDDLAWLIGPEGRPRPDAAWCRTCSPTGCRPGRRTHLGIQPS